MLFYFIYENSEDTLLLEHPFFSLKYNNKKNILLIKAHTARLTLNHYWQVRDCGLIGRSDQSKHIGFNNNSPR